LFFFNFSACKGPPFLFCLKDWLEIFCGELSLDDEGLITLDFFDLDLFSIPLLALVDLLLPFPLALSGLLT